MQISTSRNAPLGDSDAHVFAWRIKIIARWLLIATLAATILLFLFFRPAAYLAAIPIPLLFIAWLAARYLERQSRIAVLRRPGQTAISQQEADIDVEYSGIYAGFLIAVALAIGTFAIAASIYDWPIVGIAATALLLLAIVINVPYIPLIVSEAERDEREKLRAAPRKEERTGAAQK